MDKTEQVATKYPTAEIPSELKKKVANIGEKMVSLERNTQMNSDKEKEPKNLQHLK